MNIHVSEEIRNKYPTYEFRGTRFTLRNGKEYIRALHKTLNDIHFYSFEEDFFWLDKDDILTL